MRIVAQDKECANCGKEDNKCANCGRGKRMCELSMRKKGARIVEENNKMYEMCQREKNNE